MSQRLEDARQRMRDAGIDPSEQYWRRTDTYGKVRAQMLATMQARAISKVEETPYADGYIDGLALALSIIEAGSVAVGVAPQQEEK